MLMQISPAKVNNKIKTKENLSNKFQKTQQKPNAFHLFQFLINLGK